MRRALLGVLAVLGTITACGGDDDDAGTGAVEASAAGTTAVAGTSGAPATTAAREGFEFVSPAGDYTVWFDEEPEAQEEQVPLPDGTTIDVTIYLDEAPGGRAYAVNSIDYGAGAQLSLEGARDGAVENVGAELVGSEEITLQGRDGLEFTADVGDGQADYVGRVYVDGTRLYQLVVVGEDVPPDDAGRAAFLDSFQFTEDG